MANETPPPEADYTYIRYGVLGLIIITALAAGAYASGRTLKRGPVEEMQYGADVVFSIPEAIIFDQNGHRVVQVNPGYRLADGAVSNACETIYDGYYVGVNDCERDFGPLDNILGHGPLQVKIDPNDTDYTLSDLQTILGSGYEHRTTAAERDAFLWRIAIGMGAILGGVGAYQGKKLLDSKAVANAETRRLKYLEHMKMILEKNKANTGDPFDTPNHPQKEFPGGIPAPTQQQLADHLQAVRDRFEVGKVEKYIKQRYGRVWLECLETHYKYEQFLAEIDRKLIIEDLMRLMEYMLQGKIIPQELYYLRNVSKWFPDEKRNN